MHKLLDILDQYAKTSGQCINKKKTSMIFSQNVEVATKDEILDLWETRGTQQFEKYLCLTPVIGLSKKRAFLEIKANLWKRLQS